MLDQAIIDALGRLFNQSVFSMVQINGLPESLESAIDFYGINPFKLKVGGHIEEDVDRLRRIASVLDRSSDSWSGNEEFGSVEPVIELWMQLTSDSKLTRLCESILFIEQPIGRSQALNQSVSDLSAFKSVEIDESDSGMETFRNDLKLGYEGISSKTCKGFYRSILNRASVEKWNNETNCSRYFMSAEDLTTQAGVAVQQH